MTRHSNRNNPLDYDDFDSYSRYGKHGKAKYSSASMNNTTPSRQQAHPSKSNPQSSVETSQSANHSPLYSSRAKKTQGSSPYGARDKQGVPNTPPHVDKAYVFEPIPDYSKSPKTNLENLSPFAHTYGETEKDYSRSNYGKHGQASHSKQKKTMPFKKKIILGIAIFLGVALLATSAYGLWFMNEFNSLIAFSSKEKGELDKVLTKPDYNKPFYALLLGSDSREDSGVDNDVEDYALNREHSDVVMLLRIDAPNKVVTMVSVPRDTPVDMPDGTVIKLNEVYTLQGSAGSVEAVKKITGVDITHVCNVRLSEMEKIVDHLGGIEVDVDRKLSVNHSITGERIELEPGRQTLNGKQAQAFLRGRHAYADTNNQEGSRQTNVRAFMQALMKKVLQKPLPELPGMILDLAHYINSDANSGELLDLGMRLNGSGLKVYSCSGPSEGAIMDQYEGKWMCYRNPEGWKALMDQVNAGKEPQKIDYAKTALVE